MPASSDADADAGAGGSSWRRVAPPYGVAGGVVLAAAGLLFGLRPLTDNSFFTHLATGRVIVESGSVPHADPYTFTAFGEPWVVQSWLASWLYGITERLAGGTGLRILVAVTFAAVAWVGWLLTRAADGVVARLALAAVFVGVGGGLWAERPLMFGLVAFGCTILAADGRLDRRWLLVVGWLWVNVHGSFPLGLVYLIVVAVGARLDGVRSVHERGALRWLAAGVAAGAVGPLGPRVLLFPIELLQRQDLLRHVTEWQAPTFQDLSQRLFVVQLVCAVVLLVRRPSYRSGLVLAVFAAAALLGVRNVTTASLAVLPAMAAAMPQVGSLRSGMRGSVASGMAAVGVAAALLVGSARMNELDFRLTSYPMDALAFLQAHKVDLEEHRAAAPDVVGNVIELLYGPGRRVFYDDRFDMFPRSVSEANLSLVRADVGVRPALAGERIDLVIWPAGAALAQRLIADADWRVLYVDEDWIVVCARGAEMGSEVGRC